MVSPRRTFSPTTPRRALATTDGHMAHQHLPVRGTKKLRTTRAPRSPEELARAALALRLQRCEAAGKDLRAFIQLAVQDDRGRPLEIAPLHEAWLQHLSYCEKHRLHCMILAPFGHGKSSSLAVPLIAWSLGRDPGTRAKIITNDDGNAVRRVMGVARIMESPIYGRIFPWFKRGSKWTDHELYVERRGHALDPSVQARGVSGTGIGTRADLLVFDDVVDQRNSMDPAQRKKVTDLVEQTWLSRLSPQGRVLYIATPWHLDDATHNFMQRQGWCALVQRVSADCSSIDQEVLGAGADYPGLLGG